MSVLQSTLNTRTEAFEQNRTDMLEMIGILEELHEEAAKGGGEEAIARLASRNKMPIRERVARALDPDTPFLEISSIAAWRSPFAVGSGFVLGVGVISGVECVILGHDPSVRAGAFNAFNSKKLMRGLEIARENRLPYVQFVESAGADLRGQGGGGRSRGGHPARVGHFAESGRLFYEITELSKMRIPPCPWCSVLHRRRRLPARHERLQHLHQEAVEGVSRGPPLVKMATGEDADDESLGGAEMHTRSRASATTWPKTSWTASALLESDGAPELAQAGPGPIAAGGRAVTTRRSCSAGLARPQAPFDMRDVIARIVDGSRFEEFKPLYGPTLVCGWASCTASRSASWATTGAVLGIGREGGAVHPAVQPDRRAAALPAQHHRLHRRHRLRAGRHHQERLEDDQRGVQLDGAAHHRDRRRLVRRR